MNDRYKLSFNYDSDDDILTVSVFDSERNKGCFAMEVVGDRDQRAVGGMLIEGLGFGEILFAQLLTRILKGSSGKALNSFVGSSV